MSTGHLFVLNGRIENFLYDAVIIPTDHAFTVEPHWSAVTGAVDPAAKPTGWPRPFAGSSGLTVRRTGSGDHNMQERRGRPGVGAAASRGEVGGSCGVRVKVLTPTPRTPTGPMAENTAIADTICRTIDLGVTITGAALDGQDRRPGCWT